MVLPPWMLGFGSNRLSADMNRVLALLFDQGVFDVQFLQLQQLQEENSPNLVIEVVNVYFHESERLLKDLRESLMERDCSDYKRMRIHLNNLIGSSSSIGAKRVSSACVAVCAALEHHNHSRCLRGLELLEHEYCYLKTSSTNYSRLSSKGYWHLKLDDRDTQCRKISFFLQNVQVKEFD